MLFPKQFFILLLINLSVALESDEDCGYADETSGLIVDGVQVKELEWPWSVAIFHKVDGVNLRFICGGTLITRKKIITAAHCIHEKYSSEAKKVEDFQIKLGVYNLSHVEDDAVVVTPKSVSIHPDWNPKDLRYDADIAVIELPFEMKYSKFIRPICIWERRRGRPWFTEGIVVGWGQTDVKVLAHEDIARKIKIPVISNEQCFLDQRSFAALSSNRTFCGGAKNGQGPCKGDSGSGLFFKSDDKFYLGGIVSASTVDIYRNCDVKNYATYTEVYKFDLWLSNKKFREKSRSEAACDRFRKERPKRPSWFKTSQLEDNEAEIGEFPHMALLGFGRAIDGSSIQYKCNGFLVSEKFVASAAHCLLFNDLVHVRLGAISDTTLDDKMKPIAVDIKIKKMLRHEKFSSSKHQHDIGLIELEEAAPLSYFIWPACLYQKLDVSSQIWIASSRRTYDGTTELTSNMTYFLKVPVQEDLEEACPEYLAEVNTNLTREQFCVKSVIKSKTLCRGSSGAPFQVLLNGFNYVGGMSSYGPICFFSSVTVSPRIASYIEWIEEKVWPDQDEHEMDIRMNILSTTKPSAVVDSFVFPSD